MIPIAIVGTRHAVNPEQVRSLIDAFLMDFAGQEIEIVSGECPTGVDQIAKEYAPEHGHKFHGYPTSDETGTFAQRCFKRDAKIATRARYVLALPCEHSVGTYVTVWLFNAKGGQRAAVHVIPCGRRDLATPHDPA